VIHRFQDGRKRAGEKANRVVTPSMSARTQRSLKAADLDRQHVTLP